VIQIANCKLPKLVRFTIVYIQYITKLLNKVSIIIIIIIIIIIRRRHVYIMLPHRGGILGVIKTVF
jgi:hypothetical protein